MTTFPTETIKALCDHLDTRSLVLFTGAGLNQGLITDSQREFPMGSALSKEICIHLLSDLTLDITLAEAAEISEFKCGRRELNSFINDQFKGFKPGAIHTIIPKLPFHSIYTTNYDTLLEQASEKNDQLRISPIYSELTDVSCLTNKTIPYYKIHGSIDVANTEQGFLVITRRDYDHYEKFRKKLFKRLAVDIASKSFMFVGYSLGDSNIIKIINDCLEQTGTGILPRSFWLQRQVNPTQASYWKEKYNIEIIQGDAVELFAILQNEFNARGGRISIEDQSLANLLPIDPSASLPTFAEAFYRLDCQRCSGPSNASLFFKGGEPTWADIRDNIPPPRDEVATLTDALLEDIIRPESGPQLYLVSGHAGTGKTTLIKTVAFNLANNLEVEVYYHIYGTYLDARAFKALITSENPSRIIIVFGNAGTYSKEISHFTSEARRLKLPISIILEERTNQWSASITQENTIVRPTTINLGKLSSNEIHQILDALTKHRCLDKIQDLSRESQIEHFERLAEKELLVALRELTQATSFDIIIRDEFNNIPTPEGKKAYLYTACVGQIDLSLSYQTIMRVTGVNHDKVKEKIFTATDGVLVTAETRGKSIYNSGFKLSTRHPIIASVIFSIGAPEDEDKFQVINDILTYADLGFQEDRKLVNEITKRRELVETISDPNIRRAVYDRLSNIMPDDPYVHQHRSILERELGDPDSAIAFARRAVELGHGKAAFVNTLGFAFEAKAKYAHSALEKSAFLDQAEKIFRNGVERIRTDPYAYVGLAHVLRSKAELINNEKGRVKIRAEMLSVLQAGIEATDSHNVVVTELARIKDKAFDKEGLLSILYEGLKEKPNDSQLRDVLTSTHITNNNLEQALVVASEGTKLDPTAWRLHRHCARIIREMGASDSRIDSHYSAAVRHNANDIGLLVEYGAYLFMKGEFKSASEIFEKSQKLKISGNAQNTHKVVWIKEKNAKKIFAGRISKVISNSGEILSIPENYHVHYWRDSQHNTILKINDSVHFELGFNAFGTIARIIDNNPVSIL